MNVKNFICKNQDADEESLTACCYQTGCRLLAACSVALASPVWSLTINESVRLAMETNPIAKTLNIDVEAGEAKLKQKESGYYPQISLSAEGGSSRSTGKTWTSHTRSSLDVKQMVFDFYKTRHQIESTEFKLKNKEFLRKEGRQRLALLVSKAYLEVLKLRQILALMDDNIAFYERLLEQMQQREKAGASSFSDVQRIQSLLQNARTIQVAYQADNTFAREAFTLIVGQAPDNLVIPALEKMNVSLNLPGVITRTLASYYGVMAKRQNIESARSSLAESRSERYPDISLKASVSSEHSLQTQSKWKSDNKMLVVLSYNLWDGGNLEQRISENHSLFLRSQYQLDDYLKNLEKDVREAYNSMKRFREEKRLNSEALAINKQIVQLYREEFDLGQRNLIDITTAQNDYHKSMVDSVYFHYEYYSSMMNIMFYLNKVTESVSKL
ncbi:TolC family protein [Endozoicomonas gorgoniicola]|uniref:TolC family protein n=1 Tax=Endozoicomonas gorgoniicola TaxID=1234144 RepID=A0ABT3MTC8_9GAMM|nr:TolC family protein [Endozoicomonas gorgoniicola]MCW7552617.1 TolC family protein [Endozoicomonas gorgoniicola]